MFVFRFKDKDSVQHIMTYVQQVFVRFQASGDRLRGRWREGFCQNVWFMAAQTAGGKADDVQQASRR